MNMRSHTTQRLSDVKITSEAERAVAAMQAQREARAAQDAIEIQRLGVEPERRFLTLRGEGAFRKIASMGGQRNLNASEQRVIAGFCARESPVIYLALEFDKRTRRYWGYVMNRNEGRVYREFDHCELGYVEETSGHPMTRLPRQEYYQMYWFSLNWRESGRVQATLASVESIIPAHCSGGKLDFIRRQPPPALLAFLPVVCGAVRGPVRVWCRAAGRFPCPGRRVCRRV